MKFKVGDKVRVRDDLMVGRYYFTENKEIADVVMPSMKSLAGKIVTISKVYENGKYRIKENSLNWTAEMFESLTNNKIVITTDGETTTAKLYNGKNVVKTAIAKCSPSDAFDFATGARIAFDRLVEEKPTYYNGKVVCIDNYNGAYAYTVGKIYEVKEGRVTIDNGNTIPETPVKNIDELKKILLCEFIEVVE